MFDALPEIRWTDAVDVLLVAALAWAVFGWLRRARSRLALLGVFFLSLIYLAARQLDLQLTVWILQGFFAVLVIVLAVVFQEDLRRFFEQLVVMGLRRRAAALPTGAVDALVRAVQQQAKTRTGALYVIPGRGPLDPHLEGGIELDARLSVPLLLSLFDPHSPGHDGAVVVTASRVSRFAVHLPLSTNHQRLRAHGTRHAAALGLAERTDALAVVVSEERGTVSVARDGELRRLKSPDRLGAEIRTFLEHTAAGGDGSTTWRAAMRRWPETAGALVLAVAMWLVLVPRSNVIEAERSAVVTAELPAAYRLESIEPSEVRVRLRGPRRLVPKTVEIRLEPDLGLLELGRRTFEILPSQVDVRTGVTVLDVAPESVRLSLAVGEIEPE